MLASKGCVKAGDIDSDGDMDCLWVGEWRQANIQRLHAVIF
jgi:hypothetical protein